MSILPVLLLLSAGTAQQEPAPPATPPATAPAQEPGPFTNLAGPNALPLSLEDAIRLAQEHGSSLQQARLAALLQEAGIQTADGAYDPVLFGDLTYAYRESPAGGFFSAFGTTETTSVTATQGLRQALTTGGSFSFSLQETYNDYSFLDDPQSNVALNFEWRQPLLRGGWRLSATQVLEQARFTSDRSQAGLRQAQTDVTQAVVDAYWDLGFALADVIVKERSLALAQSLKEVTEAKFRVGAVAEVEVVQTDADIANRTDALLTARHNVQVAQDALRLLIFGFDNPQEWTLDIEPTSRPGMPGAAMPSWEEAFAIARENRADLRQLRVDVDAAQLSWDAAKHDLKPTLDFLATGSLTGQDDQVGAAIDYIWDRNFPGASVGLSFELPLGNNAQQGAERQARWRTWLALRTLRDAENVVATDVREAVRNLAFQAERVNVTRLAREVATRQLEAEQRRLQEGASTNFQVLQFQTDLAVAETNEVQAHVDHGKALIRLNTVRGLNWDGSRPDLAELDRYLPEARFERRESSDR